jgi:hypothetical protein
MGERRRNARYGSFKRKGIHFTVLNIYARNTLRKAINTAKKEIAPRVARFDEMLANDAARKRGRLNALSSPAQPIEFVDDDDLVGLL